jgi:hypothetical protein
MRGSIEMEMKKSVYTDRICPRCGGRMYSDRSYYRRGNLAGWFEQETCLQCGYVNYSPGGPQPAAQAVSGETPPPVLVLTDRRE